jgi:hypothetical protein
MGWPVELEHYLAVTPFGDVAYESMLTAEGPQAKTVVKATASTVFSSEPSVNVSVGGQGRRGSRSVQVYGPSPAARYANRLRTVNAYMRQAQRTEQGIEAHNRQLQQQNLAASRLLYEVTGRDFGPDPQAWLDWWMQYNEFQQSGEKPVYTRNYHDPRFVRDGPVIKVVYSFVSCFARGTLIWTRSGLTPVEQIQPGDLVLAQDPDTGELAYKPILQTTLRPTSPLRRICVEDEEIAATLGHAFWVSGEGWRMAKELKAGQPLHSPHGSWPIRQIDELPEDQAYNMVVDDFHTYFVGRLGLLVHDNDFRQPTTAVLPGLHRIRE